MYLEIEFKNAGFWNNFGKIKNNDFYVENGISKKRIEPTTFDTIILKSNVINMLHVLVDKRPVPLKRKTNAIFDNNILSFKNDIYVKINNLESNSIFDSNLSSLQQTIHTNKSQWNSNQDNTGRSWTILKNLFNYENNMDRYYIIKNLIDKYLPNDKNITLNELGQFLKLIHNIIEYSNLEKNEKFKHLLINISKKEFLDNIENFLFVDKINTNPNNTTAFLNYINNEDNLENVLLLENLFNKKDFNQNDITVLKKYIIFIQEYKKCIKTLKNLNKELNGNYQENFNNILNSKYDPLIDFYNEFKNKKNLPTYILNFIMFGTSWGGSKSNIYINTINNGISSEKSLYKLNGNIIVKVNDKYIKELINSSMCATFLDSGLTYIKKIHSESTFNKYNYIHLKDTSV
jgi:hypothetical protein